VNDQLQRFMFNAAPVRGEIVSLQNTWREVLARREYPEPIRQLLGEMMAAAALLSANLKFDGALVMQIHGDGPVKMLVVQCNSDLTMRATAKVMGDIAPDAKLADLVNLNGGGRFAITLDPADKHPGRQPYQGVVPLSNEDGPLASMSEVLEHYMRRSEQLETRIWLAADAEHAVGMLLQKLLEIDTETLLRRLFSQENVRRFEPANTRFLCTCSRTKVGGMLHMLGREEVDGIIEERGHVEIHCEFCNQRYEFDPVDVAQLFAAPSISAGVLEATEQKH